MTRISSSNRNQATADQSSIGGVKYQIVIDPFNGNISVRLVSEAGAFSGDAHVNQAVYVRANGETDVINYTNQNQPVVAIYTLESDGLILGMNEAGVPVIQTSNQTLMISPDIIYQQNTDGQS